MRALFYNCNSGISGDMNIGALIDLGVPAEFLSSELSKLSLDREFRLEVRRDHKMAIWGTRAEVILKNQQSADHSHDHGHDHNHETDHVHRTYRDICRIIEESPFGDSIKSTTNAMFKVIGEAEAKIHGMSLDDIHFHEVGATDSIVDIFAAAIALDYLNIATVLCSPVEVGSGYVECAHGKFPVPAPATSEILQGVPCRFGTVDGEATTPTGAAILKCTIDEFEPTRTFTPKTVGYGIGHRDFSVPNVLRVMIGEYQDHLDVPSQLPAADNYEIVTNIDDMIAEAFEPLLERLFDEGASDVFLTPIVMKKSRLAQRVTVLCRSQDKEKLADLLLQESSTIGVQINPVFKRTLRRVIESVKTSYGVVSVKVVTQPNGKRRWKIEHDQVAKMAREQGTGYSELRAILEKEVADQLAGLN